MMLPDFLIERYINLGTIGMDPFDPSFIQPASIDMRLDRYFRFYAKDRRGAPLDPKSPERRTVMVEREMFQLNPQEFVLAATVEKIRFPDWIGGRIEGKSSLGRMGLLVHCTAGFMDPGFSGPVTLEIYNVNSMPIILYADMKICQMSFHIMKREVRKPYGSEGMGSKYVSEEPGPVESMYWRNYEQ